MISVSKNRNSVLILFLVACLFFLGVVTFVIGEADCKSDADFVSYSTFSSSDEYDEYGMYDSDVESEDLNIYGLPDTSYVESDFVDDIGAFQELDETSTDYVDVSYGLSGDIVS